jgi:hypothetical protein
LHELLGHPIVGCYVTGQGNLSTYHFALELPSHELADITGVFCGDFIGRRPVKPEYSVLRIPKSVLDRFINDRKVA